MSSNANMQFHDYLTRETTGINGNGIIVKKNLPIYEHRPPRNRNKEKVVCSTYGPNRHTKWKGYFFCNECDLFDQLMPHKKTSAKRQKKTYTCKANHRSNLHPTHKKESSSIFKRHLTGSRLFKMKRKSGKKRKREVEEINEVVSADDSVTASDSNDDETYYNPTDDESATCSSEESSINSATDNVSIRKILMEYAKEQGVSNKELAKELVNLHLDEEFLEGEFLDEMLLASKSYYRKHVFTAHNVLKHMDYAGGVLSYRGIEILRSIEREWFDGKKRFYTIIPSTGSLQYYAKKVEVLGNNICPFKMISTQFGEGIQFDYKSCMELLLRTHKIWDVTDRTIEISGSIDGNTITKSVNCITAGFKMIDLGIVCPITGKVLNLTIDIDNVDNGILTQSRDRCFPMKITIGQENKEGFINFEDFYEFLIDLTSADVNGKNKVYPHMLPFSISRCADHSAHQKATRKGGACKVKKLFCFCCTTTSDECFVPNTTNCAKYCSNADEKWNCYHKDFFSSVETADLEERIASIESVIGGIVPPLQQASIQYNGEATEDDYTNPKSIWFNDFGNIQDKQRFITKLTNELLKRNIRTNGSLSSKRSRLLERLKKEKKLNEYKLKLKHCSEDEHAFYRAEEAVPCILHLENRIGLVLMHLIFLEGHSNCEDESLFPNVGRSVGARWKKYVEDIEQLVNESILGTEENPSQWHFPLNETKTNVGMLRLDNNRTRLIVDDLEEIINATCTDENRKTLWKRSLNNIRIALILLRKRSNYTHDEMNNFQRHVDLFAQDWVTLWGESGITNYIHMLISGHLIDYMIRYKCLYRFSQQGWENINSLIKTFFFKRTNHGGNAGRSKTAVPKSKLKAIGKWQQRRMVFMTGFTQEQIEKEYIKITKENLLLEESIHNN